MPGVVVNMRGVSDQIAEGDYPVVLAGVTVSKTQKGDIKVLMRTTIKDSGTQFDGRPLFRSFVIPNMELPENADKDIHGILYYMQEAFLIFGADEEAVTSEEFDPEACGKEMVGSRALATVTYRVNTREPEKPFLDVRFKDSDL